MTFGSSVTLGMTASPYAFGQPQPSALEAVARAAHSHRFTVHAISPVTVGAIERIADAAGEPGALNRSTSMSFGRTLGIAASAESLPIEILRSPPARDHHGLREPLVLPAHIPGAAG